MVMSYLLLRLLQLGRCGYGRYASWEFLLARKPFSRRILDGSWYRKTCIYREPPDHDISCGVDGGTCVGKEFLKVPDTKGWWLKTA